MTTSIIPPAEALESDLAEMCGIFALAAGHMREFGIKLAEKCDKHHGFLVALKNRLGGAVRITLLRQLEMLGRGLIDERLALTPCVDARMQLVMKLPIDDQRKVLDAGVCVPTSDDDHVVKRVGDLTYDECRAVFSPKGVRTPAQAWSTLASFRADHEATAAKYRADEESTKKKARAIAKRCNMRMTAEGLRLENGEIITASDLAALEWLF